MIREFWDAVAVSNQEQAYVIYFAQRKAPIKINLSVNLKYSFARVNS